LIEGWIWWTLLASVMQSVRTATQKLLVRDMSAVAATLVRYLFGLPFAWAYFWFVWGSESQVFPEVGDRFFISASLAGILQILATVFLVRLFNLRNFAVGSIYVRTEIVFTALLGTVFFAEAVSVTGWAAMFICLAGLMSISGGGRLGKALLSDFLTPSALYGLLSGLCLALTSLFLRDASLSLNAGSSLSAAITLVYMVSLQTLMCLVYTGLRDARQLRLVIKLWRPSLFVGVTSVAGSAGWFTAMTLMSATYVKTLGQIEFVFSFFLAVYFFREKPSRSELLGMFLILVSAIVLLLG